MQLDTIGSYVENHTYIWFLPRKKSRFLPQFREHLLQVVEVKSPFAVLEMEYSRICINNEDQNHLSMKLQQSSLQQILQT